MSDTFEGQTSDIRERMQDVARTVESVLPPHTGFIVFAFDFGDRYQSVEYVSNGSRKDCVELMQAWIDRQHRKPA